MAGVAQINNVYIFPGVGLGALVSGATAISDGMFLAAARALTQIAVGSGTLLPAIRDLRATAVSVALAVAHRAGEEGLATRGAPFDVEASMWTPRY
jgi:malate dehydrogenase (oxaloacetate-decarboxylating)